MVNWKHNKISISEYCIISDDFLENTKKVLLYMANNDLIILTKAS